MKALTFGEILWDIYPDKKFIGGAPLNFAAHFKSCGGESFVCSAVGEDELGDETVERAEQFGVSCKYTSRSKSPTGACYVSLDENFVPQYDLADNVAYDDIQKPEIGSENFDVLYFGTLALRHEKNRDCIKQIIEGNNFKEIFVDLNIRKPYISKEAILLALGRATILKVSDEELPFVSETLGFDGCDISEASNRFCKLFDNIKLVIITKGSDGAFVFDKLSGKSSSCDAEKVDVVSTVGAGDSFSAAFTAKYLQKNSIASCLEIAAKVSGFVVSRKEAIPSYSLNDLI